MSMHVIDVENRDVIVVLDIAFLQSPRDEPVDFNVASPGRGYSEKAGSREKEG